MGFVSRALEIGSQDNLQGGNFLRSLTAAERDAFTAVAMKRSFLGGVRLMLEGEPADYVMVITSGWIRITVRQPGGERTVAERGPGQLVGERASLRSSVRSATVTALTEVSALVMRTEDFASFISAHPRVLVAVEDLIYGRLTEDPQGYGLAGHAGALAAPETRRRAQSLDGENCTVILTDVVRFGGPHRTDRDRLIIRREGLAMMQETLGDLWGECIYEDRGDGLLIVMPPHVPTGKVIGRLHRDLPVHLRRHNRDYAASARFQLRVAANVGPVVTDPLGMSGEAIIRTARLVEAPALKGAMPADGYSLGIIVSEFVYDTAVGQSDDFIDINEYRKVAVRLKEFRGPAWMWLADVSPLIRNPGGELGRTH